MLSVGVTYTRQELIDLFHTERLDSIKRSLKRMNIEYISSGSGKKFTLTVTAAPDNFKSLCINKLGIPAQSDFRILKHFFYQFFCNEWFQQLPYQEMERILNEDGKPMTRQVISKWVDFFEKKGFIHKSKMEYTYFVTLTLDGRTSSEEITKGDYLRAWERYWETKRNFGSYKLAFQEMCKVNGGAVSRKPKVLENGFYSELIDALVEAIESED